MTFKPSIGFKAKARIGKTMAEAFYKKAGKRLGAQLYTHKGRTRIEWAKISSGNPETLLLVHGFSDRKESLYFTSRGLTKKFDIIIPDLPGFGQSSADPNLLYSLDNYILWLGEFIEQTGLDSFHLAGCSLGGAIAAKLAAAFPAKVKTLSLVGPAGFYQLIGRSIYDDALAGINIFEIENPEEYEALQNRIFKKRPAIPVCVREHMISHAIENRLWYKKLLDELMVLDAVSSDPQALEQASLNHLCPDLTMPVMLLWGRHDTLFPCETAHFLKERLPRAQVHIFEEFGHAPHLEGPKALADRILAFINSQSF